MGSVLLVRVRGPGSFTLLTSHTRTRVVNHTPHTYVCRHIQHTHTCTYAHTCTPMHTHNVHTTYTHECTVHTHKVGRTVSKSGPFIFQKGD